MSRVIRTAAPLRVLATTAAVEAYLLEKVAGATAGLIGLEQEMFVTTAQGQPPGFAAIEAVLKHMAASLPEALTVTEKGRVIGVTAPGLGDVCLEPGGQVELSSAPSADLAALEERQQRLMQALEQATEALGLRVVGAGHLPAFKGAALMPRSRFAAYAAYCRATHGDEKAEALLDTMKSCTGLQVNVDPMGDDFHKIYRALLLVELAGAFKDRSLRQQRFAETYAPLFPGQVTPLFNALAARDNQSLMGMIVERLLDLRMPFVPDPDSAEGFLPSAQVYGETPTVGELMTRGVLTAELLDNALSLQMTMPNLRRHGVVETRNPDTPADLAGVMAVARRYHRAAYDSALREKLLEGSVAIKPEALAAVFNQRFKLPEATLMAQPLGDGVTVGGLVQGVDKLLVGTEKHSTIKAIKPNY